MATCWSWIQSAKVIPFMISTSWSTCIDRLRRFSSQYILSFVRVISFFEISPSSSVTVSSSFPASLIVVPDVISAPLSFREVLQFLVLSSVHEATSALPSWSWWSERVTFMPP